jgi:hypothetical protein
MVRARRFEYNYALGHSYRTFGNLMRMLERGVLELEPRVQRSGLMYSQLYSQYITLEELGSVVEREKKPGWFLDHVYMI